MLCFLLSYGTPGLLKEFSYFSVDVPVAWTQLLRSFEMFCGFVRITKLTLHDSGNAITVWSLAHESPSSAQVEASATELHCESGDVLLSQFIRGTQILLTATQDGVVQRWDLSSLSIAGNGVECLRMKDKPTHVTVSEDGRILASYFSDNKIYVWDLESGKIISRVTTPTQVSNIRLSPAGDMLASVHDVDRRIRMWNTNTIDGRLHHVLWGHSRERLCATFLSNSLNDRLTLITGAWDRRLLFWTVSRTSPDIVPAVQQCRWTAVCAGPADGEFLLGNEKGELVSLELGEQQTLTSICNFGSAIEKIACSTIGKIAIGMKDEIRLIDSITGQAQLLEGHPGELYNLLFSPNGSVLVTAHGYSQKDSPEIVFWDTATRAILGRCELQGIAAVQSFAFDREGHRLFTDSQVVNNVLQVFDTSAGREGDLLRSVRLYDTVGAGPGLAVSPDGKQIALACHIGVRLYTSDSLEETHVMTGHSKRVTAVAYSPNGRVLAAAEGRDDCNLKLWDPSTFEIKLELPTKVPWELRNLTFTRDGNALAMLDVGSHITIWAAASPQETDVVDW